MSVAISHSPARQAQFGDDDGRVCLTQTVHEGRFLIRFVTVQFDQTRADVDTACDAIEEAAGTTG